MRILRLAVVALSAAACADEMPRDVREATTPPAETAPADTFIDELGGSELPPGGYVDWIADLRGELPRVLQLAETDRGEALDALHRLHTSRHEPLREYFGEGGRAFAGDAMAQAVARADTFFQELMRQLASAEVPQDLLRETVTALQQSLAEIEAEGTAAGLPTNAPRE